MKVARESVAAGTVVASLFLAVTKSPSGKYNRGSCGASMSDMTEVERHDHGPPV